MSEIRNEGGEAQLDVQYAGGISYPVQNVYYTTAGRPPFNASIGTPDNNSEPYLEFLQYLLAQKNPPQTISTSYGDEEQTVPIEYAKRVCGMFAQLGARGVTFLFSSGDGGVGDGDGVGRLSVVICVNADRLSTHRVLIRLTVYRMTARTRERSFLLSLLHAHSALIRFDIE